MEFNDNWNRYQKALYFDKINDWSKAHDLIDGHPGPEAAHIHAYLHRKEGDEWNAGYWYRQAHKEMFKGTLEEEWENLWGLYNQ